MTGGSLGLRTGSCGILQNINGAIAGGGISKSLGSVRKSSTKMLSSIREKERPLPNVWYRYIGSRKVSMLLLIAFALLVFVLGSFVVNKAPVLQRIGTLGKVPYVNGGHHETSQILGEKDKKKDEHYYVANSLKGSVGNRFQISHFTFPLPPPPTRRRIGPRPCPVCYLPVDQAIASMPSSPSASPVLHKLTNVLDESPIKSEPRGGSDFGGYPSLKQRNDSFDIKESMTMHCGKPGHRTGFDFDESDLAELQQFHDIIVSSAIFGNYDVTQQPQNTSEEAKKNMPFSMFIDEETEAFMKNRSILKSS